MSKHAITCPLHQQSTPADQRPTQAVIFTRNGEVAHFKCLHRDCDGTHTLKDLLAWANTREPGVVDRFCSRLYQPVITEADKPATDEDGLGKKPRFFETISQEARTEERPAVDWKSLARNSTSASTGKFYHHAAIYPQDSILEPFMQLGRECTESADCYLLGAILPMTAAMLERRVSIPWSGGASLYPNEFSMLAGPPGGGKSGAIGLARRVAKRVLPPNAFLPKRFSPEAMFDQYHPDSGGRPDKLWVVDEGKVILMEWIQSPNGARIAAQILDLYDCPDIDEAFLRNQKKEGGQATRVVAETSTSIVFGATFGAASFQGTLVQEGMARRFLFYVAEKRARIIDEPPTVDVTPLAAEFATLLGYQGVLKRTREAEALWRHYRRALDQRLDDANVADEALRARLSTAGGAVMKTAIGFEASRAAQSRLPQIGDIRESTLESAIQCVEENLRAAAFLDRISERSATRQRAEAILAHIRRDFPATGPTIYVEKTALTRKFCPNPGRAGSLQTDELYFKIIPHLEACGEALRVKPKRKRDPEVFAFRVEGGGPDDPDDDGGDPPSPRVDTPADGATSTTSTFSTGGDTSETENPTRTQPFISTNSTLSSISGVQTPPLCVSPPVEIVETVETIEKSTTSDFAWVGGPDARASLEREWPKLLSAPDPIAADFETYGELKTREALEPHRGEARLLTVRIACGRPVLFDVQAIGYHGAPWAELFQGRQVIMHNARFDATWLRVKFGISLPNVFCTMTAAQVLSNGDRTVSNKLDDALKRYLGLPLSKDQQKSDWGSMLLTEGQLSYAAGDVLHLHDLRAKLEEELNSAGLWKTFELEMALVPVVVAMQSEGMPLSRKKLQAALEGVEKEKQTHLEALKGHLGPWINYNSPEQLKAAFRSLGVQLESTEEDALVECNHPAAQALLNYREVEAVCRQAKSLLPKVINDRIYSDFLPMGTRTGRFSSKAENLQNVARGVLRTCFIPPSGDRTLVIADYGQIELRAAAFFSKDERMIEAFRGGKDLHALTASAVLGKPVEQVTKADRQLAKAVNFGLLYGQREAGLVRYAKSSYGVDLTREQAERLRKRFFSHYRGLAQWHRKAWDWAEGVDSPEARTIIGRRRWIPEESDEKRRAWMRFQGKTNTLVQGSCADGLKLSMVALHKRLPDGSRMVSCVHDELIIETPRAVAQETLRITKAVMQETFELLFEGLPVEADAKICETWGNK
jgi:DNA polymerase I-like protein with 3'-5' exonuclease and polymerase domains